MLVETETFSSGGFRDAFLGVSKTKKKWVIKTYNETAKETITTTLQSSTEDHTRKQIQMHAAARHLANLFTRKAPGEFGQCFKFNRACYTVYAGNPVTVEEFIEGTFRKYVNNDGNMRKQPQGSNADIKIIFEKAECLVHFFYVESSKKLMLQGAEYNLYDPEIATTQWRRDNEIYFCCGNLSTTSINEFNKNYLCNKFCRIMKLSDTDDPESF